MPRGAALLTHATLGALAITAITAAMPPQGKAAGSRASAPAAAAASAAQLSSSPTKDSHMLLHPHHTISETLSSHAYGEGSPMRPRSKVVHVPVRGSTLVVPLACTGAAGRDGGSRDAAVRRVGGASAGAGGGFGFLHRAKTVEAPIELSDGEVSLMANRQYRVRDSVFIH